MKLDFHSKLPLFLRRFFQRKFLVNELYQTVVAPSPEKISQLYEKLVLFFENGGSVHTRHKHGANALQIITLLYVYNLAEQTEIEKSIVYLLKEGALVGQERKYRHNWRDKSCYFIYSCYAPILTAAQGKTPKLFDLFLEKINTKCELNHWLQKLDTLYETPHSGVYDPVRLEQALEKMENKIALLEERELLMRQVAVSPQLAVNSRSYLEEKKLHFKI